MNIVLDVCKYSRNYFQSVNSAINSIGSIELNNLSQMVLEVINSKRKIIIAGNGGSSAIASHVSVDFTKAAKVRAINFNESDLITCFANDYGYENWIAMALRAYADAGDLVILISSSGQSQNIISAANTAVEMGLNLVTLSGFNSENPLRRLGAINLWVNSDSYNVVEMAHHVWLLAVVEVIAEIQR